jgi:hypothetical protein
MTQRLEGFLFTILDRQGNRSEVHLQGSGGEYGAGCLSAANTLIGNPRREEYIQRVSDDVLGRARREARETGAVRVVDPNPAASWETRIQQVLVTCVESVRPVFHAA